MTKRNRNPQFLLATILGFLAIWISSNELLHGYPGETSFHYTSITFHYPLDMNENSGTKNDTVSFKESIRRLNYSIIQYDKEALIEQKEVLNSWLKDSTLAPFAHYYMAYCNYRLNTSFLDDSNDIDGKLTDEALKHLEAAKEHEPLKAEVLALQSSFYGMKISGPLSAMKYGSKANDCIEKAVELAPNNPRVRMLDAIGSYYKPSFAGGGIEKSINGLKKSIRLFEISDNESASEQHTEELIGWGRAESYAWLGKIYIEQENWSNAQDMLLQALDINKDYYWVHEELNPSLPDSLQINGNY